VSTSGSPGTGFNTRQSLGSADTINSFRNNGLEFSEPFTRKYFTISLITVKGESFNTFYFSIKKESYVLGIFSQGFRFYENQIIFTWIIFQLETEKGHASAPDFRHCQQ
jgi:hypothetical protein